MDKQNLEVPSRRYGRYCVKHRLGVGGMAEVFFAEAGNPGTVPLKVALKLMKKGMSEDAFSEEADLMGILEHPNLLSRLEYGMAFGRPYIAMEHMAGGDLRNLIDLHKSQRRRVMPGMAIYITIEVLRGLAYFHTATAKSGTPLNLVHSDVNPSNIFIGGDAEIKLGDFGVATSQQAGIGLEAGVTAGKLSYLSPEQTRTEQATPLSDLWAVGVMLYEMLCGYHPFAEEGSSDDSVMSAIRSGNVGFPESIDFRLVVINQKALSVNPMQRFQSAGAFAGALFEYALDTNLLPPKRLVRAYFESLLGLLGDM